MTNRSIDARLRKLEAETESGSTHFIWRNPRESEAAARARYHAPIMPSDKVVFISWEQAA